MSLVGLVRFGFVVGFDAHCEADGVLEFFQGFAVGDFFIVRSDDVEAVDGGSE